MQAEATPDYYEPARSLDPAAALREIPQQPPALCPAAPASVQGHSGSPRLSVPTLTGVAFLRGRRRCGFASPTPCPADCALLPSQAANGLPVGHIRWLLVPGPDKNGKCPCTTARCRHGV